MSASLFLTTLAPCTPSGAQRSSWDRHYETTLARIMLAHERIANRELPPNQRLGGQHDVGATDTMTASRSPLAWGSQDDASNVGGHGRICRFAFMTPSSGIVHQARHGTSLAAKEESTPIVRSAVPRKRVSFLNPDAPTVTSIDCADTANTVPSSTFHYEITRLLKSFTGTHGHACTNEAAKELTAAVLRRDGALVLGHIRAFEKLLFGKPCIERRVLEACGSQETHESLSCSSEAEGNDLCKTADFHRVVSAFLANTKAPEVLAALITLPMAPPKDTDIRR